MDECYFSDEDIMEQSECIMKRLDGSFTNGISLVVGNSSGACEIILEYEELIVLMKSLQLDRDIHPEIYGSK